MINTSAHSAALRPTILGKFSEENRAWKRTSKGGELIAFGHCRARPYSLSREPERSRDCARSVQAMYQAIDPRLERQQL